jgi:GNAT superfamily N-acetyltransferase
MFENEYLMQVTVADRLREARATAWRATVARRAAQSASAEDPAPITYRDTRALELVGLGYAISDGALVVYYPHLLVLPAYRRRGVGRGIVQRLMARYEGYHQHILVADGSAIDFYRKAGFERAGRTEPMWIYAGAEH